MLLNSRNHVKILSFLLMILSLSCTNRDIEPEVISDTAVAGDIHLKKDVKEISGIDYSVEKGWIIVNENRENASSNLIRLPILKILSAQTTSNYPIFYLAGGPGASNMHFSRIESLIDSHDIILIGYRGVDGSVRLDCPEVDRFFKLVKGDFFTKESVEMLSNAFSNCASRHQEEGIDTDGYHMVEVVHDLEEARRALGYERIHLLSQSYGTRLAMYYSWMYPENLERSVMISVNPPGRFVWYPDVLDSQLKYYSELCSNDPICSSKTNDLVETIRTAKSAMPKRWLFFPIKKGNVLMGTFMMLYHTETAQKVFDAWIAAGNGDWSGIAMLSKMMDFFIKGASVWGESTAKAMSADYIFEEGSNPLSELMPDQSVLGAPASFLGIAGARGWPVKYIPDSLRKVNYSDTQTLSISGNIDVSTPAQFAKEELLPFLSNGHQVILSEFGHTGDIWTKQPEAIQYLLSTFFRTGEVDDSKFEYAPMDFKVKFGYPEIMKLGLVIAFFSIVLILLAFRFLFKKFSKPRRS